MTLGWRIFKKRVQELHARMDPVDSKCADHVEDFSPIIEPVPPAAPPQNMVSSRKSDISRHTDYSHYKNTNIKSQRRLRELRWYTNWERRNSAARARKKIKPRMKIIPEQHELGATIPFSNHWYSHFPHCSMPAPEYPKTPRMKNLFQRKMCPITSKITGMPGSLPRKNKHCYVYKQSDFVNPVHAEYMENKELAVAQIEGLLQRLTPVATPDLP
eukprot:TRINITY_DN24612_c0_g1_i1.p1 TRINITY_DN24612_c0_g1~~TRINITY_DN24612_c0_g1_i1.p1  ORF type:complete len:215 (+),score=16.57 TRINITY_DN24612_c0_g1_i1:26-670(+)